MEASQEKHDFIPKDMLEDFHCAHAYGTTISISKMKQILEMSFHVFENTNLVV